MCAYFQAFCYILHYLRLPRIYQKRKLYGLLRPPFSRNQLFVYSERQKRDVAYFYNKGSLYGPTVINFTMCLVLQRTLFLSCEIQRQSRKEVPRYLF